MRADAIGIFWQDLPRKKGERASRVMPPIPDTGWQAPSEFPNLSRAGALAFDVETYDPELLDHGPGWARGKGHVVGYALGTPDGGRWYFPIRHTVRDQENMDPEVVTRFVKDVLETPDIPKVGANLIYDVGWCREEGIHVQGELHDVQYAEALLREELEVNLDVLGERYLNEGKTSNVLYQWCADYYGGAPTQGQRKNLYRAPPCLVGPYAEGDVDLPLRVLNPQWQALVEQDLYHVYRMECDLIYLMVDMRFAGVRVDLDLAEQLRASMVEELVDIDKQLKEWAGFAVNINSNEEMAKAFDNIGLHYGYTEKGNPTFTKRTLTSQKHPFTDLVLLKREREKLIGTFIDSYILDSHVDGFLYGEFKQLRSTDGGARSGRYSSSNPNLQNIPARTELGKKIRMCFVPDVGHIKWRKVDYSQIEYRGLAHYAVGDGADDVRRQYNNDPDTDFHVAVQQIIKAVVGLDLDRPLVKNINFGSTYGMGKKRLSGYLGLTKKQAYELFDAIHKAAPFLRETMDTTSHEAERLGYITTIMGRRSRFNLYVPGHYDKAAKPVPFDKAILMYANPKRAYTHKALNRRLQGSAADLLKKAMLDCYQGGLFDEVGVPRLTVHDELDFSVSEPNPEAFRAIYDVMENAIQFRVPIRVSVEDGPNWGEVKEVSH